MMAALSNGIHGVSNAALLANYKIRFEEISSMERRKDDLIIELLQQNERLATILQRTEDDLEREKSYARMSQKEIRDLRMHCNDAEERLVSNPYVQVLIDGDGMLFHLDLLKKKTEGGSEAAELLLNEIQDLGKQKKEELHMSNDFEIRVLVFANLDGLAKSLVRSNLLKPGDLQQFFIGFTQRLEHVNFIDVGYGKEMADSKIRGEFLFHMKDPRCRLILFGGSHDNGYAPFLNTRTATNSTCPIWLLEGAPMAEGIKKLNLPTFGFYNLFSKETQEQLRGSTSPPISMPVLASPTGSANGGGAAFTGNERFSYASAAISAPPGLARPQSIKYNTSPIVEAAKTIVISGSGVTSSSSGRTAISNGTPSTPHPMVPSADGERVNYIKNLNPRACNNFYLRGSCYSQPCPYSHKWKLTGEDIKTLKYIIERSKPCQQLKKRGQCDDDKCYYGHECPFRSGEQVAMDDRCTNYNCRFCNE